MYNKDDIDKQAENEGRALSFMAKNRLNRCRISDRNFDKTKHARKEFDDLFRK